MFSDNMDQIKIIGRSKQYYQHNSLREHSNKQSTVTSPDRTLQWFKIMIAYINENIDAIHLYINTNISPGKLKRKLINKYMFAMYNVHEK